MPTIALIFVVIVAIILLAFLLVPAVELCTGVNPLAFYEMPGYEMPEATQALALQSGKVFRQTLKCIPDRTIASIQIRFATYQRVNNGILSVMLYEDENEIASWVLMTNKLVDNAVETFKLDKPYNTNADSEYRLEISESYRENNAVALWINDEVPGGYYWGDDYNKGSVCYIFDYKHTYTKTYRVLLPVTALIAILAFVLLRRLFRKRTVSPAVLFCAIAVISLIAFATVCLLAQTEFWTMFFFRGESSYFRFADTGMDFYHSIEYLRGNDPYQLFGTIYPPLANLLFKVCYHLVPIKQKMEWQDDYMSSAYLRRTSNDLRVWMPTAMLFLLFFIVVTLLAYAIITNYDGRKYHGLFAFLILFNTSYLYALERGNIIILAMTTALFFVLFYDSPNRLARELALFSLAISANLKMYPAVFGLLLLYDKKWKEAVRAIIYGIALFVLPCLFFKGGFKNVLVCLNNIKGFAGAIWPDNIGTSIDKLLYSVFTLAERYLGVPFPSGFYFGHGLTINRVMLPLCIICGLILPKKWQKCLCCTMGIILFSNQGIYGTILITMPAVLFFREEDRFSGNNVAPFIGIALCMVCMPVFNSAGDGFSFTSFRLQIGMFILLVYIVVATVRALIFKRKRTMMAQRI